MTLSNSTVYNMSWLKTLHSICILTVYNKRVLKEYTSVIASYLARRYPHVIIRTI